MYRLPLKQLTKILPINWIENVLICKAQEGKGHGRKCDRGGKRPDYSDFMEADQKIPVLGLVKNRGGSKDAL